MDLFARSLRIILENQSPTGAYPACPNFPTYRFSWFRDGAFIAYAMDRAGECHSAARFHAWAAGVIEARSALVCRAVEKAGRGEPLEPADILHTRYGLDGEVSGEDWPNFQLDGFGTWLWALAEHRRIAGASLPGEWLRAAGLAADYLAVLWRRPCFDCWEEFPDRVHTYTLAAIHAGLRAEMALNGRDRSPILRDIEAFIARHAVRDGSFVKSEGNASGLVEVDASLLGLAIPYRVVAPDDARMLATVARIEAGLRRGGGVHRYAADTYYGGGEWVLLAAWLGWYYAELGDVEKARELLCWVGSQAGENGWLPEQVSVNLIDPAFYQPWVDRWGPVASPLLWSHAKYILLASTLEGR